jgi:cell cycle sensor histidine kinase DivJ
MKWRFTALSRQLGRLVHPAITEPVELVRHAWFVGSRFACGAVGLAMLPLLLAVFGAVQPAALLAVTGLVVQAFAALMVSRSGRLAPGQTVSQIAAAIAIAAVVVAGEGLLSPVHAALTLLVIEAGFLGRKAAMRSAIILSALVLIAAVILAQPNAAGVVMLGIHLCFLAAATTLASLTIRDLTTRVLREKKLAVQNAILMEGFGELMTRHDAQGNVRHAGSAAMNVVGVPAATLLGRGLLDRVHVADRPLFLMTLADAAASPDMAINVVRMRRDDIADAGPPQFAWIEVKARQFAQVDEDDPPETVCLLSDVTARKRYEADIEAARLDAESASAMKDRFLATVSHELRTPLNAIIGFAEMLGDGRLVPPGDPRRYEYARIVKVSGEHLLGVVNTLLDLSRIDGGTFGIEPEPFELPPLVDTAVSLLRLKADEGGVALGVRIEPGLPPLVADRRACKQILLNLLSNAVKFTPSGGRVLLDVRREGETLVLRVEDSGIGISATDLPRIGEPFFQVAGTYDRRYEGTGLGFSVVKGLVALHSGSLVLDSQPGRGTVVTIRLGLDTRIPLTPAPSRERDTVLAPLCANPPAASIPGGSQRHEPVKKFA